MVMTGSTMAYLWFNIPPAKFIMGETGAAGVLLTIGVVAILIDYIYILPIAGFILFLTPISAIVQVFSKKVFKRKVLKAAPLHHHLEAIGWERTQITMRYWLISIMTSALGLAIGLIFR
jgi:phospho-N-acetylmuramoyl-pentapeptide-transferase